MKLNIFLFKIRAINLLVVIIFILSVCNSQQNNLEINLEGEINIFIGTEQYYVIRNGDVVEINRLEFTNEVSKDKRYIKLVNKRDSVITQSIQSAKNKILDKGNKLGITEFSPFYFTANPTAEYAMQLRYKNLRRYYDGILSKDTVEVPSNDARPIKIIYNLNTGDSIEVRTSDGDVELFLISYSWSQDGKWLAIERSNKSDESSIIIVNLEKKENEKFIIDNEENIEAITWGHKSNFVAVLTTEWLRERTIWNYILFPAWFHPQMVQSYYLYIIKPEEGIIKKIEIAHRIDYSYVYGLFWIE